MIRIDRGDETLDQQYSTLWSRHDGGREPSVADFLATHPDASPSERSDVLLADQWLRWCSGRPKTVGDYLAEHPSLADDPESILKLVQGEFLARLDRGEAPDPAAYARMFPTLAEPILRQCEVDRWLTMPAPPEPLMSMATTADYPIGDAARADAVATDDGTRTDPASGQSVALEAPLPEADFELVRPLGSGGMGEVYEAIQRSLRKRVALKLIRREALGSPSRMRRFFAEARALARLRHPHIVGVHGIGRMADGRYFLVMDLIEDGTTLAELLKQGPVPFDRAAVLVATVAEAIEHAHSRGVVHRDLKPSNVLLDAEGRPHVTDFGLAKIFDATDPDHPPTTADQILGTPHYMTPEQADPARGPIAPRTDVYALGGLLYALLTGRPPIQGDSLTAILTQIVSPEPVPSPRALRVDVPAGLERICATCLEKDAEKRHPSAGAVAAALRAWLMNPEAEDAVAVAVDFPGSATSTCATGGVDQETGLRVGLEDDLAPPPPPRPSGPPLHVAVIGGLLGVGALTLLILSLIKSVGGAEGWRNYGWFFLGIVSGYGLFSVVQFLRLKSAKLLMVALTLGVVVNVMVLVAMPVFEAYWAAEGSASFVYSDDPQDSRVKILAPEEQLDPRKIGFGITLLVIYAGLAVYLRSPAVKKPLQRAFVETQIRLADEARRAGRTDEAMAIINKLREQYKDKPTWPTSSRRPPDGRRPAPRRPARRRRRGQGPHRR